MRTIQPAALWNGAMEAAARAAEAQAAGAAAAARSDRLERLVPSSVGEPEPAPAPTLSAASGGSEHGQSLLDSSSSDEDSEDLSALLGAAPITAAPATQGDANKLDAGADPASSPFGSADSLLDSGPVVESAEIGVATAGSVWDDPELHLFGQESLRAPSPSPLLRESIALRESIELFAAPPRASTDAAALTAPAAPAAAPAPAAPAAPAAAPAPAAPAAPAPAPAPEPQLQSPAVGAVDMKPLVRLAWVWQETGHATEIVWVRRLVTLDEYGNVCVFSSDRAPRPEICVRREDCSIRAPRTRRVNHPHAFRVDSSEHRTDGVYTYKLVLSPCENPEEESANWVSALSIDRSRCDDTEADAHRKAEPGWRSDADRRSCARCTAGFSLLKRRHHCRICGDIFCDPCCEIRQNMPLRGYSTPQRVCGGCARKHEQTAFIQTQLLAGGRLLGCGAFEAAMEAFDIGTKSVADSTDERLMALVAGMQAATSAKVVQDESRAFADKKHVEARRLREERDYTGAIAAFDEALARGSLINSPSMVAQLEEDLNSTVAAKLAQEEAVYAATTALTRGSKLLATQASVEEGVDVLSSEYIWQEYSGAIEAFRAGLAEDTGNTLLTQRLQQALREADNEAAHVDARKKRMEGDTLFEAKDFTGACEAYEAGIALEQEVQVRSGGSQSPTPLEGKLRENAAVAQLQHRRSQALAAVTVADERIRQGELVQAVELLTSVLTLDIGDPELSTRLKATLATAHAETTTAVHDKIAGSERMMTISAWDDACGALSDALNLVPALPSEDAQSLGEKLREALAYAEASNECERGERDMVAKMFESAAKAFQKGLECSKRQQRDETMSDRLQRSFDAARAAKLEQDTARERAKALHEQAGVLAKDDDTLEEAIAAFEAGLALRSATNGGTGFTLGVPNPMEACMTGLEQGLTKTKASMLSRDAARRAAKEQLVKGSRLMQDSATQMSVVISCFEQGLQQQQHKNHAALNAQLQTALAEAKRRVSHAADTAAQYLVKGTELMSARKFEDAVVAFQAGLALRAEAAGASSLMERLAVGVGDAERGIAVREASRKTAERLLAEGTSLVVAKDFKTAALAFRDGLLEQTDDDELTHELEESLAVSEEALKACSEAREVRACLCAKP